MAFRLRNFREISRRLPRYLYSGNHYLHSRRDIIFPASYFIPFPHMWEKINKSIIERGDRAAYRFSTVSEASHQSSPGVDLLTFFESTFDELEGFIHSLKAPRHDDLLSPCAFSGGSPE